MHTFWKKIDIIDYSLLVGIHNSAIKKDKLTGVPSETQSVKESASENDPKVSYGNLIQKQKRHHSSEDVFRKSDGTISKVSVAQPTTLYTSYVHTPNSSLEILAPSKSADSSPILLPNANFSPQIVPVSEIKSTSSNSPSPVPTLNIAEDILMPLHSSVIEKLPKRKSTITPRNANDYGPLETDFDKLSKSDYIATPSIFKEHCGGMQEKNEDEAEGEEIYYIGIIDTLMAFQMRKKLEHVGKSMINISDPLGVSVVPPAKYAQRFIDFISGIVE